MPELLPIGGVAHGSGNGQHLVGIVFSAGGWRQGFSFPPIQLKCLVYQFAGLGKHFFLVAAMAAAVKQTRTASDETLVLVGPFHNLGVPRALFHLFASSMAARTAFSWYRLASSPGLRERVIGLLTIGWTKFR